MNSEHSVDVKGWLTRAKELVIQCNFPKKISSLNIICKEYGWLILGLFLFVQLCAQACYYSELSDVLHTISYRTAMIRDSINELKHYR